MSFKEILKSTLIGLAIIVFVALLAFAPIVKEGISNGGSIESGGYKIDVVDVGDSRCYILTTEKGSEMSCIRKR